MKEQPLKPLKDVSQEETEVGFLTPAEVRSFPKFANASDEEVWNIINTLHKLSLVTYNAFVKEEAKKSSDIL